jgi:hypothetical protein
MNLTKEALYARVKFYQKIGKSETVAIGLTALDFDTKRENVEVVKMEMEDYK